MNQASDDAQSKPPTDQGETMLTEQTNTEQSERADDERPWNRCRCCSSIVEIDDDTIADRDIVICQSCGWKYECAHWEDGGWSLETATGRPDEVDTEAIAKAQSATGDGWKVLTSKSEDLPVKLDPDEVRERGKMLAAEMQKLLAHSAHEMQIKQQLKAVRTEIETEIQRLGSVVRAEQESRPVRVTVIGDFRRNVILEIRTDTGEEIRSRTMHPHELSTAQGEMFTDGGNGASDQDESHESILDEETERAAAIMRRLVTRMNAGEELLEEEQLMVDEARALDEPSEDRSAQETREPRRVIVTDVTDDDGLVPTSGEEITAALVAALDPLMPPDDDDPMVPEHGVLSVRCPQANCHVPPGEWCKTPSGKRAPRVHKVRKVAAETHDREVDELAALRDQ